MTSLFDIAGIAWRALGRRQDIEALAARAVPFYTPVVAAYRAIMAAHQRDPKFIGDATDLYNAVAGLPETPQAPTPAINVQWVQETVNTLDNAGLTVDGYYGLRTHQAVMIYQQNRGLIPDGWTGPETFAQMIADLKAKASR